MIIRLLLLSAAWLIGGSGYASDQAGEGHDVYFFVQDDHPDRAELDGVEGHPCGFVMPMRVNRIPEFPDGGPIAPSEILEFDEGGAIIGIWRVPADYMIEALSGDRILLNVHGTQWRRMWIDRNGRMDASVRDAADDAFNARSCPATIEAHYGYPANCATLIDEQDASERHLAFDGVCT